MKIDAIVVGQRTRRDLTKIDQLARSIERVGLIQPPVVREVDGEFRLVCGGRRLAAMRHLGWTETRVTVAHDLTDELAALLAEGEENTERERFTVAEAVEHRRRIREVEARLAKERQGARTDLQPDEGTSSQVGKKSTERRTAHRSAKATGFGATTLDKAERIIAVAEDPETPEPVREVARESVRALGQPGVKVDAERRRVEEALVSHVEGDQSVADAKYRAALTKAIASVKLPSFDPERVAEVADDDTMLAVDLIADGISRWRERIKKERAGLRLVKGGAR